MGDEEKTTDRRPNMHKSGARWAGHLDGDTQQPAPSPASLLYRVAKLGGTAVLRGGDIVILRDRRNL
jgi:hypothetical protein